MKNKKLFRGDIIKSCAVCSRGRLSASGENVFCERRGVTDAGDCCRAFDYDPLRRVPRKPELKGNFTAEDFRL